jgi:hypothetical protein
LQSDVPAPHLRELERVRLMRDHRRSLPGHLRIVIASEAKQSRAARDCFVAFGSSQ